MEHAVVQTDVDRYIIVEYLAEGGMGAIFLGKKVGMGGFEKEVVLKQLLPEFTSQPEFIDLFLREAKLSAALDHANIIHTIDLVAAGNDYFIVMEYVRGGDLRTILRRIKYRGHRIDPAAAIFVAREILSALAYAHEKKSSDGTALKLIHRDVSPSNIMVSAAGEVKLADFGIAKASTHKSVFYRVKGKVGYMSPEQAYGETLDLRSDLYSLAVCLHEMLCGERLFVADLLTTPDQIYDQPIPKLDGRPDVPRGMDRVMARALARDPDRRYQTALELQDALVQVAYDSAMLFTGPDLAAHLRDVCGDDPGAWNKENEEEEGQDDDENRPGTQLLGSDERSDRSPHFSGVELTSVFTGLDQALGAEPPDEPGARSDGGAMRDRGIDRRGIAFDATRLQVDGVRASRKGSAARDPAAAAFDFSDLPIGRSGELITDSSSDEHPAARWPQQPPDISGEEWSTDEEGDPTVALGHGDSPPFPAPRSTSGHPATPSAEGDDATIELRVHNAYESFEAKPPTFDSRPPTFEVKPPTRDTARRTLRNKLDAQRPSKRPDPLLLTDRVRDEPATKSHHTLMLIAVALLLLSGGAIALLVGLTGPSLDDEQRAAQQQAAGGRTPRDATATPNAALVDAASGVPAPHDRGMDLPPPPPDRALAPTGEKGVLKVESTPTRAAVYLDDVRQCETPCTIEELEPGRVYVLSVRRKNYISWSALIDIGVERRRTATAPLLEEPDVRKVGWLLIDSSPVAEIAVDGKDFGRVTSEGRIPLPEGQYEITLSHPQRRKRPRFQVTIRNRETVVLETRNKRGEATWD